MELTRRLRAGAVGRSGKVVPIMALTANAFAEDRTACLEAAVLRWTEAAPPSGPKPRTSGRTLA